MWDEKREHIEHVGKIYGSVNAKYKWEFFSSTQQCKMTILFLLYCPCLLWNNETKALVLIRRIVIFLRP